MELKKHDYVQVAFLDSGPNPRELGSWPGRVLNGGEYEVDVELLVEESDDGQELEELLLECDLKLTDLPEHQETGNPILQNVNVEWCRLIRRPELTRWDLVTAPLGYPSEDDTRDCRLQPAIEALVFELTEAIDEDACEEGDSGYDAAGKDALQHAIDVLCDLRDGKKKLT